PPCPGLAQRPFVPLPALTLANAQLSSSAQFGLLTIDYSLSFTEYAGYSVAEMIAIAYVSRFDFQEHEQEFAEKVHRWGATQLKRRQIRFLASLCRRFENIGYDPLPDHELVEEPEAVEEAPLYSAA
ncbi:hypothetical protein, partial [Bradyrhizobium sp. Mp27]